jgi:RNA polymerase sigma-70 factor (ECF subfamily)
LGRDRLIIESIEGTLSERSEAIEDRQIVQLIQDGHTESYSMLVRSYHRKVLGYCLSMLNNRTDAEEAAQDIFVKAYQALARFKGDSSFSTWLYRITANHCLDILRKRNRRRTVSWDALVEKDGERMHALFASDDPGSSRMEDRQLADKILGTLTEDYRTVLTLREQDGLEYQEIAGILNCSLDAVKGRLARARKQLQEKLSSFVDGKAAGTAEGWGKP